MPLWKTCKHRMHSKRHYSFIMVYCSAWFILPSALFSLLFIFMYICVNHAQERRGVMWNVQCVISIL